MMRRVMRIASSVTSRSSDALRKLKRIAGGVSGRLDATMFGPPVPIHLTEFMEGRGRPGKSGPLDGNGRRSIDEVLPVGIGVDCQRHIDEPGDQWNQNGDGDL